MIPDMAPEGGIVLSRLSKSYGAVRAVRSLDLAIAPGETVALLGPNGAGKTTTIDMMLGLTRPDQGTVSVFGVPPARAVQAGWIGGMLQTGAPLDHLRVRELIALTASYYPAPLGVEDVLRLTGADAFAGQWTTKLSGGQAQRVRFAAALVGDPDLLLLDEPTAGIDVEGRRDFWQSMRAIAARGKTVVFATHYLEEADAYADRIVLIANGRLVADGPATEIKAQAASRTIRATLPDADTAALRALPGVLAADRHGDTVMLSCSDADTALRALLAAFPAIRDVEVRGGSLEEAFMELTAGQRDTATRRHGGSTMIGTTHFRYEVLRTLRNRVFYGVTLALPLVLFFGVASGQRHATFNGTSFPLYFMTAMAVYGSMFAVVGPGARIARDIAGGWTRQLRITPLRPRTDLTAKVVSAYLLALPTLVLLYLAGTSLGVRLAAGQWLEMTGLILVGLVPFVVIGFVLGYLDAGRRADPGAGRDRGPVLPLRRRVRLRTCEVRPAVRRHEGTAFVLARAGR